MNKLLVALIAGGFATVGCLCDSLIHSAQEAEAIIRTAQVCRRLASRTNHEFRRLSGATAPA